MMAALRDTGEEVTPLQLKLNALAELIAKIGSSAGLILFTALMIRFFVQLATNPNRFVPSTRLQKQEADCLNTERVTKRLRTLFKS